VRIGIYHPELVLRDVGATLEEMLARFVEARARRLSLAKAGGIPGTRLIQSSTELREVRLAELGRREIMPGEDELGEWGSWLRRQIIRPSRQLRKEIAGAVLDQRLPLRGETRRLLIEMFELLLFPLSGKTIFQTTWLELLELINRLFYQRGLVEAQTAEELIGRVALAPPPRPRQTVVVSGLYPFLPPDLMLIACLDHRRPLLSSGHVWLDFDLPHGHGQDARVGFFMSPDEEELVGREGLSPLVDTIARRLREPWLGELFG